MVYKIALRSFPLHLMLSVALALAALIMLAFTVYHVHAISYGVTGSEQRKLTALWTSPLKVRSRLSATRCPALLL